ncbi:hypothetical protein PG996_004645 [Apiospora saccharicola]|uniref:Uncharacterized protein n=1 Tax=Apiospora saccharicola TaxID=335842 RepID=A0ABR1W4P0_9PEZI
MSQHPLAPSRFKHPRNWLVPLELVHDLNDRQHCRTCQRCKIDRERREQEKAKRDKAEVEAEKKLHQPTDPNHREKCSTCQTTYDRYASRKLKQAHDKGIEASRKANSAWSAPYVIGLCCSRYQAETVPSLLQGLQALNLSPKYRVLRLVANQERSRSRAIGAP